MVLCELMAKVQPVTIRDSSARGQSASCYSEPFFMFFEAGYVDKVSTRN